MLTPQSLTVVFVDDQDRWEEQARRQLTERGMTMLTCVDLSSATDMLLPQKGKIVREVHIALFDFNIVGGYGLKVSVIRDLFTRIKERGIAVAVCADGTDGWSHRLAEKLGVHLYPKLFNHFDDIALQEWGRRGERVNTPLLDGDQLAFGMRRVSRELA